MRYGDSVTVYELPSNSCNTEGTNQSLSGQEVAAAALVSPACTPWLMGCDILPHRHASRYT